MATVEQTKNAKDFSEYWKDKGAEKQEAQRYWIGLLQEVLGIENPSRYIEFEKPVKLSHASFIDGFINSTKVLIEQKGSKVDLTKAYPQSDGTILTPYQQAKRYADELPYDLRPRWIVVSNFKEIHIHDMNNPHTEPEIVKLGNLEKEYYRLQFLVDTKNEKIRREEEISLQAGILVGKLYDALIKEFINPDEKSLRSLNILCVRLVFCLYAEDAGFFESRTCFEDYIKSFNLPDLREGLIKLFKGLDTKLENRDKYDLKLKPFPYVNGGLFAAEDIEIPNFTQEIVDVLVKDCATFDWHEISPTIFGAVFESTLNPETRRTGGMHYTSIENIHKVIDPLFMDELEAEFEKICATTNAKTKNDKLHAFQDKLGNLKFLDPACGSGNFLTETYLSLRRLENKVLTILSNGEKLLGFDEFIKVKINQFYGIEINDFAVTVAKTALWIAESQMIQETEKILSQSIDFFPLHSNAYIHEGNALRMDWETFEVLPESKNVIYADKTNIYKIDSDDTTVISEPTVKYGEVNIVTKEVEFKSIEELQTPKTISVSYDYIMGNPPFVGKKEQSKRQKEDMDLVFKEENNKGLGILDYVCSWYYKATKIIQNKKTRCAFVSTNSITQGEQATVLWKMLFSEFNFSIDFAYQTFKWENETLDKKHMAAVHCVIISFSSYGNNVKTIFNNEGEKISVKNINQYLCNAPAVFIESRTTPISKSLAMCYGSMPIDDGHLILTKDDVELLLKENPENKKFIRSYMGGAELIKNQERWCLWLKDFSPKELKSSRFVAERVKQTKDFRLSSGRSQTQNLASIPWLFGEIRQPETNMIVVPKVSSEARRYIPISFVSPEIIINGSALIVPNASLYEFGVLTSSIHNSWMRTVAGRMKSDYQYSSNIVYNNFPWCNPTDEQKAKIEKTAQAILDARGKYPESSLADLYDETFMPSKLRKAHQSNDRAVMEAYHFDKLSDHASITLSNHKFDMTETEIVAELFKMYEKLTKESK